MMNHERDDQSMNTDRAIPQRTSTHDFERYVPTAPTLSSSSLGWESVVVRVHQEPSEMKEELIVPTTPDILLLLTISGVMHVERRAQDGSQRSYIARAEDFCLTPGNAAPCSLRWKSLSPDPNHTLYLHLNQRLYSRAVEELVDRDPARLVLRDHSVFQDPLLLQLALGLQREVRQLTSASKLYVETIAETMIVHLLRHYSTQHIALPEYLQRLSRQQMKLVTDFILAHLQDPLSLSMLAQQIGFSSYHFARLFRRTTGQSPHQFVLDKRLEAAQRLLKETDLPLARLAVEVGFSNQGHFTQVFKRHVGLTPLRYRQQS